MSDHLPECEWNDETRVNRRCICDRLRACEARVRERTIVSYDMKRAEQAERNGYAAALDAVQRRVLGLTVTEHTAHFQDTVLFHINALRGQS